MKARMTALTLALALPAVTMGFTLRHITPTVVLHKQADVIRGTLTEADQFFVRTVEVGRADRAALERAADFTPDDAEYKFYYGLNTAGDTVGVVLFPQVNTQHGPLEVGLVFGADHAVRRAIVTKATVETKPWVQTAVRSGFLDRLVHQRAGDDPAVALEGLSADSLGRMPFYMAGVAVTAVRRGQALYDVLYLKRTETH